MAITISTRTVSETFAKKDQDWRITVYRDPGQGIVIIFHRRIQEFDQSGVQHGNPINYDMRCIPSDDSRFATILSTLDQIGDDIATARGIAGIGD